MPQDLPEIELYKQLFSRHDDALPPEDILRDAPAQTITALYDWLFKSQNNHGFTVAEPAAGAHVDKAFATKAILAVLNQFERTVQDAEEAELIGATAKAKDSMGYEDQRGRGRAAYSLTGGQQDARFPCADREYAGIKKTLANLQWQGNEDAKRDRIKKLTSVIMEALASGERIPLDDLPKGETRPVAQVFCLVSTAPKGGGRFTYFSDIHATGWLAQKLDIIPRMIKTDYPGFITVSAFNKKLGRNNRREENAELKNFLIKVLKEGTPIPTPLGDVSPASVIKWSRSAGGGVGRHTPDKNGLTLYAKADILEPLVRKHLICGKTEEHKDWLNPRQILNGLGLSYDNKLYCLALHIILCDMWQNHRDEISGKLGIFKANARFFYLADTIKGNSFMHPDAVGTLVTRDMVLAKAAEIKGHEHEILERLKREIAAKAGPATSLPPPP